MNRKFLVQVLPVCMIAILFSCTKNKAGVDNRGKFPLPGYIYHQYTSDVMKIDMGTRKETAFFSYSAYGTVGWDLSRDGKIRFISTREPGAYDRNLFTLVNTGNETVIRSFEYRPRYGNSTRNSAEISFDNTMLMVAPDNDNGIVIMDMEGQIKFEMSGIGGEKFNANDNAYWLPGNAILVRFGNKLFRSVPPYHDLSLVKDMDYEKWGNVRVSGDGRKISFYINEHIFMMDINGDNLVQVTDSDGDEAFGEFSPDGKFLLIGADYFHAPSSGNSHWFLKIIPADGKKYDMDSSPEVTPVVPQGETSAVRASKVTLWRAR